MNSSRRLLIALLALLGCATGEPAAPPGGPLGYANASASTSCAPWDGPATEILLSPVARDSADTTSVTPPYLQISIWRAARELPGTTLDLSAENNFGAAIHCPDHGECERASAATVRFQISAPGGALLGTLDATFPTTGHVSGAFRAAWRPRTVLCG